jgi:hypothetical protein
MGVVVIGILGIFIMGQSPKQEPSVTKSEPEAAVQPSPVEPKLATDFLTWWSKGAFDYNPSTAKKSHMEAFGWMTPAAIQAFQTSYWTEDTAASVSTGQLQATFQLTSIQPEAVNPDGSVVLCLAGNLIIQASPQPTTQPLLTDFLVRRQGSDLQIAGVYNRIPASSTY